MKNTELEELESRLTGKKATAKEAVLYRAACVAACERGAVAYGFAIRPDDLPIKRHPNKLAYTIHLTTTGAPGLNPVCGANGVARLVRALAVWFRDVKATGGQNGTTAVLVVGGLKAWPAGCTEPD